MADVIQLVSAGKRPRHSGAKVLLALEQDEFLRIVELAQTNGGAARRELLELLVEAISGGASDDLLTAVMRQQRAIVSELKAGCGDGDRHA